ncbi:MAG TPA: 30S ribosomal protein S9 [Aggregatilineales bacterium]|mgnify:FL=1|jgi:small subunit ribosomal protein S9|nr:30S ribosomal protein S9 [Chloroflexota bacterium]HOA23744.1 30S ribosomal protein S9 [Aggregatilineales bacterium]HPV06306.1 30S ribosomal protein S9 [Aggregatilineales bacterium]HQA67182.1 30S ribosomal protein S9 [Aggregatilineales bacterium]HQE17830.1 30S ribosomal protein S9 [Aggregatilineales bacterium]
MASEQQYFEGVGRRKRASARVRIYPGGEGKIIVNDKPVEEYFRRIDTLQNLMKPLEVTGTTNRFDVTVRVYGGGVSGQADAVKMGLARALVKYDEEMRPVLRKTGFLTRDAREKERKKPGLKRARKAPTYTKR